ncbi:multidrug efflux SMR transporter [Paucilactobacillus suebicus]|uniref:Small multidrug efflux protein n=1 Tax=Paucilactobacillus suebicus DSM 5007 = KCTC 3549 TaxID=1423807 RepID=A0A0R1W7B7_9LACO|nr:multidrug efflux SMR transporter [Paucilactobacillus suebicus]KRM11883.1 small multidrug efflux protein [Paucilactobacillus suebicus DSM 5007 = KCTC 3549]
MAWIYLVIAGLFETFWATMLKFSMGFTKINFSIYTVIGMILSFWFLAKAVKTLPLGIAYPVWTGIGAVGTIILGVILFGDRIPAVTWIFVVLLVVSIVGIKLTV